MNLVALPFILAAIILLVSARANWIAWQAERHLFLTAYWGRRTRQDLAVLQDALAIWPASHIVRELWCWDWRRYVVDQDLYDEMSAFIAAELKRTDLNTTQYVEELNADIAATAEAPAPEAAQPSTESLP